MRNDTISKVIEAIMAEKKLKQVDIIKKTGFSSSSVSMVLSGERNLTIQRLSKICIAFEMSLSSFFLRVAEFENEVKNDEFDFKSAFEILAKFDVLMFENNDEDAKFLREFECQLIANDKDACVAHVYEHFGELIKGKKYKRANAILSVLEKGLYPRWALLPFNTLSGPYQKEMPNRAFLDGMSPNQSWG